MDNECPHKEPPISIRHVEALTTASPYNDVYIYNWLLFEVYNNGSHSRLSSSHCN